MGLYIKIVHILIATIATFTVGIVLSLFIGIASLLDAFFNFPLQVYRNLKEQERIRRLSHLFIPSHTEAPDEDIWDKHIRRMEEKRKDEPKD
tara:strand:- start:1036 stop:1311 length:276 start_codon:yes stop_codon:yes gene_type:complete